MESKYLDLIVLAKELYEKSGERGIPDPFLKNALHEAHFSSLLGLEWNPEPNGADATKDGKLYELKMINTDSKCSGFKFNYMDSYGIDHIMKNEGVYFIERTGFDLNRFIYLPLKGILLDTIIRKAKDSKAKRNICVAFNWNELERMNDETSMGY